MLLTQSNTDQLHTGLEFELFHLWRTLGQLLTSIFLAASAVLGDGEAVKTEWVQKVFILFL